MAELNPGTKFYFDGLVEGILDRQGGSGRTDWPRSDLSSVLQVVRKQNIESSRGQNIPLALKTYCRLEEYWSWGRRNEFESFSSAFNPIVREYTGTLYWVYLRTRRLGADWYRCRNQCLQQVNKANLRLRNLWYENA